MKLNKKSFIESLENETNLNHEECVVLNKILERRLVIGKKNKTKIISDIKKSLNKTEEESFKIYNEVADIITKNIKEKIKHPLKKD